MSVANPAPILTKQQSKLPTSMRYERVRDIINNDPALKSRVGPETEAITTRFGDNMLFSKEVIEITNALHAEGRDAHKVPKNEVLRRALLIMKVRGTPAPAVKPESEAPVQETAPASPKAGDDKKKSKRTADSKATAGPVETKSKKAASAETNPAANPKPQKAAKTAKADEKAATQPTAKPAASAEDKLPESELPPEKQPLHLPANFDPRKWPHYQVQVSVYSLLLSALNLSDHFEKIPGREGRQQRLESLIKEYQDTCDAIRTEA